MQTSVDDSIFVERFIRMPEVKKITGISSTTIWRLEKSGNFPRRRRISSYAAGWLLSEIMAWIQSRPII